MKSLAPYAVFLIPIMVGLIAQAVKFILYSLKHGWDVNYAFTHGHMPSAHTALAVSMVTTVGYYEGIGDGAFAVAIVLAFIIIDDAARIRMYLGDQGRYLNMLIEQLDIDPGKFPRLKERTGHRISEIIVGALLGLILSLLFIYFIGQPSIPIG
jgi:acid phosphatase family membrane protein YuiD